MLDIYELKYRLVVMSESGAQYNIKDFAEKIGWEQNDGELATRISFTVKNNTIPDIKKKISEIVKPGCLVMIYAECSGTKGEVARGYVSKWRPVLSNSKTKFEVTAYDELYNLQKSQEMIYYSSGAGTKTVLMRIFGDWGIPVGKYNGPDVKHGKLAYKTEMLSDVIKKVLDDAKKKGGGKAFVRADEGKVSVLRWGDNDPVYAFTTSTTKEVSHTISTETMITRVKIIGKEPKEGRPPVEAVLNGKTQFGIRQKIYTRGEDETAAEAQTAAQEIINASGKEKTEIAVQGPDVPFIKKGDKVHIKAGSLNGYYFVKGIQHDADTGSMKMNLAKEDDL